MRVVDRPSTTIETGADATLDRQETFLLRADTAHSRLNYAALNHNVERLYIVQQLCNELSLRIARVPVERLARP
jgi:hypothetical protein